jgi:hypothetical protein
MTWRRKTSENVGETQLKRKQIIIRRTWMRLQRGRRRKRVKT